MTTTLDTLQTALEAALAGRIKRLKRARGELTLEVSAADYAGVATTLRDDPSLRFAQLMDLCGLDYSAWKDGLHEGPRYAVVLHLLSVHHNWRLRVRVFCPDDDMPMVASVNEIWNSANWFEREAFDLYGIIFDGHLDLRRLLTDYGFIGHPFRKDFPLSGNVEVRYDEAKKRVIYQPVTIEPRQLVPRVIREDQRYNPALRSK